MITRGHPCTKCALSFTEKLVHISSKAPVNSYIDYVICWPLWPWTEDQLEDGQYMYQPNWSQIPKFKTLGHHNQRLLFSKGSSYGSTERWIHNRTQFY